MDLTYHELTKEFDDRTSQPGLVPMSPNKATLRKHADDMGLTNSASMIYGVDQDQVRELLSRVADQFSLAINFDTSTGSAPSPQPPSPLPPKPVTVAARHCMAMIADGSRQCKVEDGLVDDQDGNPFCALPKHLAQGNWPQPASQSVASSPPPAPGPARAPGGDPRVEIEQILANRAGMSDEDLKRSMNYHLRRLPGFDDSKHRDALQRVRTRLLDGGLNPQSFDWTQVRVAGVNSSTGSASAPSGQPASTGAANTSTSTQGTASASAGAGTATNPQPAVTAPNHSTTGGPGMPDPAARVARARTAIVTDSDRVQEDVAAFGLAIAESEELAAKVFKDSSKDGKKKIDEVFVRKNGKPLTDGDEKEGGSKKADPKIVKAAKKLKADGKSKDKAEDKLLDQFGPKKAKAIDAALAVVYKKGS